MPNGDKTGVWLEEFAVPYMAFKEEGFNVTISTINGGLVPIDPSSIGSEESKWKDATNALKDSKKLSDINTNEYIAVYIPGGHGAMFDLAENKILKSVLAEFENDGKVISSVCHGPVALVGVKLKNGKYIVDGKKLTSFTDSEEKEVKKDKIMPFLLESELTKQGAIFKAKENWADNVIVDGNLITGQNPSTSKSIAKAIIESIK